MILAKLAQHVWFLTENNMFSMKNYYIFRLVVFTAFAVVIGIFAHELLPNLHYLVGAAMILFGFEGLLFPVTRSIKEFYTDYQFYLGQVELLLGIVMMSAIRDPQTVCVIWGTWTIVRESYELYETSHKFLHRFPAILSLALSVVEIVFSVLLIILAAEAEYEHHALTHVYLLVPELIINALSPLLFDYYLKYKHRKE